jgi:hypothetical protein
MKEQKLKLAAAAALLAIPMLLTSCASGGLRGAQTSYRAGAMGAAASGINSLASKEKEGARDSELVFVEQGNINATAGNTELAKQGYIHADHSIEKHLEASKIQLGNEAGALLVNLNSLPYHTSPAERLMASSYLATTFAQSGDINAARAAVKLTKDRQLQINEEFKKQIEKEQASLNQALQADPKMQIKLDQGKIDQQASSLQAAVAQYHPYNDGLSVPYAEALAGVILGSGQNAEKQRANESFNNALKANPGSASLKKAISASPTDTTHIFIEDGVAPQLGSTRFDIPIYINGALTTLSAAFPVFEATPLGGPLASVKAGGTELNPDVICDFDRIAGSEYHRKIPGTIARTMASSTLKAAAGIAGQLVAKQAGGQYGDLAANAIGLASVVYNVASAQADQRIWSTLPKQVRYACVRTPSNGVVEIGGKSIKLPSGGSNLVIARVINGQVNARTASLSGGGNSTMASGTVSGSSDNNKPALTTAAKKVEKSSSQTASATNEGVVTPKKTEVKPASVVQSSAPQSQPASGTSAMEDKIRSLSTRGQFDTEELSIRNDANLSKADRSKLLQLLWKQETAKLK